MNNYTNPVPSQDATHLSIQSSFVDEWLKSAVDLELAARNVKPISGPDLFNYLYPDPDRRNDGRLTNSFLRKWDRCQESGGWLASNGKVKVTYGPVKEFGKYLNPKGRAAKTFLPTVPSRIWESIATKYDVAANGPDFWTWVKENPTLPLEITEGEKKTGCLISHGFIAAGVPGITMGLRAKDGERQLVPELAQFDQPGRPITITFDYREGNWFKSPEFKAARTLAGLFKHAKVKIARLPGPQKGVDDFIVAGGDFETIRAEARPLSGWQDERLWLIYKEFTPDHTINRRFFDWQSPESGKITAIKSGLGTGKTQYITDKVASKRGKQINTSYRNSLLLQQAEKWGSYHLDAHNGYQVLQDPDARISLCWDSLLKVPIETFEGATLILDEVVSSVQHLLTSSTCRDKRMAILQRFKEVAPLTESIVALDGNLNDWVIQYLSEVSGKPAVKIENQFKGDTPPVYFLEPEKGKISKSEWEVFSLAVRRSKLPAIATDSRLEAEALAKQLEADGKRGILLTSKTVTDDWAKDFLANPDSYIRSDRPEFFIFSPTAESGLDISIQHYFSDVFVVIVGVLGADEAMQMSRRVRHPERIIILCAEKGLPAKDGDATYHKQVSEIVAERVTVEATLLGDKGLDDITKEAIAVQANSPDYLAWCKIQAKKTLERKHLKNFLLKNLEGAGFNVQHFPLSAVKSSVDHSEAKESCKDEESQQKFYAEDIEVEEALDIQRNFCASWADRCKAYKALLKARLPGIENSPLWTWEFIRRISFEERDLLSQLEAAWLFNNPDDAEYLQRDKWKGELRTFLPDLSNRWLKLKVLSRLGIEKFLDPSRTWTNESPEVEELLKACKKKSVANLLGHPGKLSPVRYLNKLLQTIGVRLVGKQVREGDSRQRVYQLTTESRPADWEELYSLTAQRMAEKVISVKASETPMVSDFECVTDTPVNISPTALSVTETPIDYPPQTEIVWGWLRKGMERVRVAWQGAYSECQTKFRILADIGANWSEMDVLPSEVQWEG